MFVFLLYISYKKKPMSMPLLRLGVYKVYTQTKLFPYSLITLFRETRVSSFLREKRFLVDFSIKQTLSCEPNGVLSEGFYCSHVTYLAIEKNPCFL